VILIHQRHRQTDGWRTDLTDRRTDDMQSQYRALHYSASRGKSLISIQFSMSSCYSFLFLTIYFSQDHQDAAIM